MTCDEGRLLAFLAGELDAAEERAFDEHLLTCETCWRAVREDRVGRLALDELRVSTPLGLADRVALVVRLADQSATGEPTTGESATDQSTGEHVRPAGHRRLERRGVRAASRRRTRLVAAAALLLAVLGGTLGWALQGGPATEPPQIARVVAMLSPGTADAAALRAGEQFRFGGQALTVRSYRVEGDIVLVATSSRPFPVPAGSHVPGGSSPTAWTATKGKLAMYGVNRPAGGRRASMFLVAAMPMAELPGVAARLHLI